MALFVPLDASYAQDSKVLDLDDERAELLYLRSLAYSKLHVLDGLIHRRALPSFSPFMEHVLPTELAAELVRVGLWETHEKGWRIVAWLKHNPGSEEILAPSTARQMAHKRHHENKGIIKSGCPFCVHEDPQVNADECATQCDADAVRDLPEPEPEPEPEPDKPLSPDPAESLTLVPPPGPTANADAGTKSGPRQVFDAWVKATGRNPNQTRLTADRRRIITTRLKDYPAEDLIDAVHGWKHSPHHRGENDRSTTYNDLELLLRNAKQVETFRDLTRNHQPEDRLGPQESYR